MSIKNFRKKYCAFVRLLPTVTAALSLVHVILYVCGVDLGYLNIIYATSLSSCFFMLGTSMAFSLCWIHQGLIFYSGLVSILSVVQRTFGLGVMLVPAEVCSIAAGSMLLALAPINRFA